MHGAVRKFIAMPFIAKKCTVNQLQEQKCFVFFKFMFELTAKHISLGNYTKNIQQTLNSV